MPKEMNASELIEAKIKGLGDWRGNTLASLRATILAADPGIIEEVKWRKASNPLGVPVWSRDGLICTGETYKDKVKLTFAHGAKLPDPDGLFNGPDKGATRRSIDLFEGDEIDGGALANLVRSAIAYNHANLKKNASARGK